MRQIISGQPFLYRQNGYDSTIIELKMKSKIIGSFLQISLSNTTQRFPDMTQKLVEKNGSYYLHKNNVSMNVVKTKKFRTLGSMSVGYHLIDITYFDNIIRIAFHHGLCDGT